MSRPPRAGAGVLLRGAVLGGALTALIMAGMGLAAALGLGALLEWSKKGITLFATIAAIAGFVLGGFRAGLLHPPAPLANGGLAAAVAFRPLGVAQRLVAGTAVRPLDLAFATLFAASFGVLGAFVANNANRTRQAQADQNT